MSDTKNMAAAILSKIKPGKEQDANGGMPSLEDLMQEFCEAKEAKDYSGMARAFSAAKSYEAPESESDED